MAEWSRRKNVRQGRRRVAVLKRNSERMRIERSDMREDGSAACSKRTKTITIEIEPFVDWQAESIKSTGNGEVVECKEGTELVEPWRGAK